ncbi:hypothetical protein [Mycobacterium gordonae]|uniref:hypothetical protein n=1 Tax=Mycobacterium gordonae TaxID=1778 RepID=UPI000849041D|nr:hypothetical protein [Mycobacterium gordonae]ODR16034.1 hypothetical protein BHQ23_31330 [Mycobacterium gordonae]
MNVIVFVFAGRRPNLELQLPFAHRILQDHPNVEYHLWNFARNDEDREYIKTITGERITVWNGPAEQGFDSPAPTNAPGAVQFGANEHNAAYNHYANPEYRDHLFVKLDDDITFLETGRFGKFIEAIDTHRGCSLVANTINNGACTPLTPKLWSEFSKLGIPLLDIHRSNAFADAAHTYMRHHHDEVLDQPITLVPTEDWLSINAVGYDWEFLTNILKTIGTPHPPALAGRNMRNWGKRFGDEGVFQTRRRIIMQGFTAAHLSYGPQNPTDEQLSRWRTGYAELAREYLSRSDFTNPGPLPEPTRAVCAHIGFRGNGRTRLVDSLRHEPGRPTVLR